MGETRLHEDLHTHKASKIEQIILGINYRPFSITLYVTNLNGVAILIETHNIRFDGNVLKIISKLSHYS